MNLKKLEMNKHQKKNQRQKKIKSLMKEIKFYKALFKNLYK